MDWYRLSRRLPTPGRFFVGVVGVTFLVTAALAGSAALLRGQTGGVGGRIPYYVLLTAIAFVVTLWKLDDDSIDGSTVLIATCGVAAISGAIAALAIEGLRWGLYNPGEIVASHLVVYFVSAGLFCTGLGLWAVRHWREFTSVDGADSQREADAQ